MLKVEETLDAYCQLTIVRVLLVLHGNSLAQFAYVRRSPEEQQLWDTGVFIRPSAT